MAKEQSEKNCFQSKYGGEWVTAAQFLTEIVCARLAEKTGSRLPHKFWNDAYWAKKFREQITHANNLLKEYPVECLLSALEHPDAKRIYSLGLKSVIGPLAKRDMNKRQREEEERAKIPPREKIEVNTLEKPRSPFGGKKTLLSKLRDLE